MLNEWHELRTRIYNAKFRANEKELKEKPRLAKSWDNRKKNDGDTLFDANPGLFCAARNYSERQSKL